MGQGVQNAEATKRMTDQPAPPRMFLLKTFNLTFFAGFAALAPFLVLYYEQNGLSGSEIGILTAIPPFVTLFASSMWGALGDAKPAKNVRLKILRRNILAELRVDPYK